MKATKHIRIAYAVLAAVATVVTIVGWAVPSARAWMGRNPGPGWTLAVIFAVVSAWIFIARADTIARERDRAYTAEMSLQAARTELEKAPATDRDRAQFAELLQDWPWDTGFLVYFDVRFNAKRWKGSELDPFFEWVTRWEERFFDDETVQAAYEKFFDRCQKLAQWIIRQGGPDSSSAIGSDIYSIIDGDHRAGGWPEFDKVRQEAFEYIQDIFNNRKALERVGRKRGL